MDGSDLRKVETGRSIYFVLKDYDKGEKKCESSDYSGDRK